MTRRGSAFLLCERSRTDERYPRYPALPVRQCAGYDRRLDADPDPPAAGGPPLDA